MHLLFWLQCQAFHQPAKLLFTHRPDFLLVSRPLKAAFFQTFVKKQKSIFFPDQSLDPVGFPTAEKKQCVRLERIDIILVLDQTAESIDSKPKIRITAGDVDGGKAGCIIEQLSKPVILCEAPPPMSGQ